MRYLSYLLFACLAMYAVFYPYKYFSFWGPHYFGDLQDWAVFMHWIEDDAMVPRWHPLAHLSLYLPTVLLTQGMILSGLYFVWQVIRGDLFGVPSIRSVQFVGACGALASLTFLCGQALEGWILTLYNKEYFRPIVFPWNVVQFSQFLVAAGVFMIGWILRLAMQREMENKEMI